MSRSAMPSMNDDHRLLVVRGGERRGQPQPEGPGRRQRRTAGQRGVLAQDVLRRRAVDDQVAHRLPLDAELDAWRPAPSRPRRRPSPGCVDEDAVAGVGEEERDVLVRLLAARAAVGVPDVDGLAVLDQRAEPLARGRRRCRRRRARAARARSARRRRWSSRCPCPSAPLRGEHAARRRGTPAASPVRDARARSVDRW